MRHLRLISILLICSIVILPACKSCSKSGRRSLQEKKQNSTGTEEKRPNKKTKKDKNKPVSLSQLNNIHDRIHELFRMYGEGEHNSYIFRQKVSEDNSDTTIIIELPEREFRIQTQTGIVTITSHGGIRRDNAECEQRIFLQSIKDPNLRSTRICIESKYDGVESQVCPIYVKGLLKLNKDELENSHKQIESASPGCAGGATKVHQTHSPKPEDILHGLLDRITEDL